MATPSDSIIYMQISSTNFFPCIAKSRKISQREDETTHPAAARRLYATSGRRLGVLGGDILYATRF